MIVNWRTCLPCRTKSPGPSPTRSTRRSTPGRPQCRVESIRRFTSSTCGEGIFGISALRPGFVPRCACLRTPRRAIRPMRPPTLASPSRLTCWPTTASYRRRKSGRARSPPRAARSSSMKTQRRRIACSRSSTGSLLSNGKRRSRNMSGRSSSIPTRRARPIGSAPTWP